LIWPFTAPQMRTASPEIEPRTSAPSPTVIERLTTSPSMVPSDLDVAVADQVALDLQVRTDDRRRAVREAALRAGSAAGTVLGVDAASTSIAIL